MKNKLRNGLIGLVIAASITTWFTGCSTKPEPFEMPVGPSTAISEVQPNAPDSSSIIEAGPGGNENNTGGENDMFTAMWYNSAATAEAKSELTKFKADHKLVATDSSLLGGLVDIYDSADGVQFIISGFNAQQLRNNKISASQLLTLRLEDSGQRLYVMDTQDDADGAIASMQGFKKLLEANNEVMPDNIETRVALREEMATKLAVMDKAETILAINSSPIAGRSSFASGTISVADIADASMGIVVVQSTDIQARTVTIKVNAAADTLTVVFKGDASGKLASVTANGKDISKGIEGCLMGFTEDVQLYLTPAAIQSTLGFDVEVYAGANCINVVTDEMDVFSADNIVVDTPQSSETAQSTQGAASSAAQETEYAQKQEETKPTPPPAQSKPTPPPAQSSQAPSKPKPPASKPSGGSSSANDLLNDILGGGGGSSQSSGGSSSGGGFVTGSQGTQDGSDLGSGHTPIPD